jgi:hypothetical protein
MTFKEWIVNSYKTVVIIVGALSLIGGIYGVAVTVNAANNEIQTVKKDVQDVKVGQTEYQKNVSKTLELQYNTMRLQILQDQENNLDIQIEGKSSKGKDTTKLKEQKTKVQQQKEETLNKILEKSK